MNRALSSSLVGWLWADLLLGMFVIFLAASAGGVVQPVQVKVPEHGVDARPVKVSLTINGPDLLGADAARTAAEQTRITTEVARELGALGESRKVAIVLAFATHRDPVQGDRIARAATAGLKDGQFSGSASSAYHELLPADEGSRLSLELYFYY